MSKKKRIAVAGSAANPVTKAHRAFAETLTHSGLFDLVLWLPSGMRPDKPHLISPEHRVRMTELAFHEAWRKNQPTEFKVDLREVYRHAIPTIKLLRELKNEYLDGEIFFATGVDVLAPKKEYGGKCDVLYYWEEGESLFNDWKLVVMPREGYLHPKTLQQEGKIPEHFIVIDQVPSPISKISSTEIRRRILGGEPFHDFVDTPVAEYIKQEGLYLGR
jgi:nicotinate (nicotinamide) nucleotide adenylyltransferase